MSAPIVNQARAMLDSLEEGRMDGAIFTVQFYFPSLSPAEVAQYVREVYSYVDLNDFNYWMSYFDLPEVDK